MGSVLVLGSIERICELMTPRAPLGRKIKPVWAAGLDTFTLFCSVRKMAANSRKAHVLCSCGVVGDRLWCSEFTLSTMGRFKDANLCSAYLDFCLSGSFGRCHSALELNQKNGIAMRENIN